MTATIVACARGAAGVDPFAARLVPPRVAALARPRRRLWTAPIPLVDLIRVRTLAIDDAVASAARDGIRQVVTLGAGLCARAWRLADLDESTVYEVDHPATQHYKRRRLDGLIPKARGLRFVSVDFEKDDLLHSLEATGHDANAPTTWVWEGVTPYLTPAAIAGTLGIVREQSAAGSVLVMTYYAPGRATLEWRLGTHFLHWSKWLFAAIGEPLHGLMSVTAAHDLLATHGFAVKSDDTNRELARRRFRGGHGLDWTERFVGERIAVATMQAAPRSSTG
jgi:methyltransferase (TIGR00027 family)